jgi:hypothetical protein
MGEDDGITARGLAQRAEATAVSVAFRPVPPRIHLTEMTWQNGQESD